MIILKPGSHAFRLLILLLHVGEFPYCSLGILGDTRSVKYVVNRMAEIHDVNLYNGETVFHGRLVNVSGRGRFKTIRLNAYTFEFIKEYYPELFQYYLEITHQHHFRGNRENIERNHRIAESLLMILASGIEILPGKTPQLQMRRIEVIPFKEPAFYHSRVLKVLGKNDLKKNQFTRIIGAIFYETGCYVIYNTRNAVMKWCGEGEIKTRQTMTKISSKNSMITEPSSAILFGKSYETALRTVRELETDRKEEQSFGAVYTQIHFIPMDDFGTKLLQILVSPDWKDVLLDLLFEPDQIRQEIGTFPYDAKVGGHYVLSFLDSDIVKLYRFYDHVIKNTDPWLVVCFDSQTDFLRAYMGEGVHLRIINMDEIMDVLDCKRRSLL